MKVKNNIIKSNYKINLIIDGILVGFISGFLSLFYRLLIGKTDGLRDILYAQIKSANFFLIVPLFLLMAYIISSLLKWAPLSGGSGIPQIQGEIMGKFNMNPFKTIVSKFVGGSLANIAGLSLGREGPSIQIGGAAAKFVAKLLKRSPQESRLIITAGASAGLSAAFNAPISGAIFSLEEMHRSFSHYIMIPAIISSVIANYLSFKVFGMAPEFSFAVAENLPMEYVWTVLVLGVVTGVFGVLFNQGLIQSQKLYGAIKLPLFVKISLTLFIALPFGLYSLDLLGGGHHLAELLAKNNYTISTLLIILVLKYIFTWISYGSGTQGGIFLPVLVIGAIVGVLCHKVLGNFISTESYCVNFIILAMAGMLTSVVRAPILSILLVTEMTGSFAHLISVTLVSVVAFLVAEVLKNPPIYESLLDSLLKRFKKDETIPHKECSLVEYRINSLSLCANQCLQKINWPAHLIIVSVLRGSKKFIPNSNTVLEHNDTIEVLCSKEDLYVINEYFQNTEIK